MQLINTPTLPPGCCFICKASVRDSYIDTQVSYDYEGAFYICNVCVGEMATMYSYLSFDEYKDLRVSNEELQRQNFELIKRVGELEGIHNALDNAGYKLSGDGDVVRLSGYSTVPNETREILSEGTKVAVGVGAGKTAEQSDDSEVAGLHSNDSEFNGDEFSL